MKNKQHNQIKILFILSIDKKNLGIITKTGEKFNPYVKRLKGIILNVLPSITKTDYPPY